MTKVAKITSITIFSFILMMNFNTGVYAQKKKDPVRVLLFTGGHPFDREPFDAFKQTLSGCIVTEVQHPNALTMFRPENRSSYDVVLFYDMYGSISEQEKQDFLDCLNEGKGMVVLHHAYVSYPEWPEYQKILGGAWKNQPWTDHKGVSYPASTYIHDVKFQVKIANKKHPVTKGVKDFDIIDETYADGYVAPNVHILLTTDEPTSTPSVAWTNQYGKSKVVTILLGHDQQAWNNPSFKKLITQAIFWVKK